jgi:hypothetical protein
MRIRKRFYAVTLLAAAGIAAPAQAQVTGSNITSPPDPHFVLYEIGAAHPATIDVAGTTVGSGNVDVQCVTGSRYVVVASDVPVAPNGTFAVSDAPLAALATRTSRSSRAGRAACWRCRRAPRHRTSPRSPAPGSA